MPPPNDDAPGFLPAQRDREDTPYAGAAMDLYLVRHAIAEDRDPMQWPDDGDRPLSAKGVERFEQEARGLATLVPEVDVVLASPYARAWGTAQILTKEAGWPPPVQSDALRAEHTAEESLAAIEALRGADAIAAVGHEPNLSELASLSVLGTIALPIEFKKGAVLALTFEDAVAPGRAYLRWLLPPKALRSLG
jgi:phosphohistidine phosphatase